MGTIRPLANRLPAASLAAVQQAVTGTQLDHRTALVKRYKKSTVTHYRYRMNRYRDWCRETRRQSDMSFLDNSMAEEYVRYQITHLEYHPRTIMQSLNALKYEASRAGVDPVPSMRGAYELLRTYAVAVEKALTEAAAAETPDETSP